MPKRQAGAVFWEGLVQDTSEDDKLREQRGRLLKTWAQHPWLWLAGVDPTTKDGPDGSHWPKGRPLIWTTDEKDQDQPVKPFPAHLDYLRHYVETLHTSRYVIVDKARQMIVTTATLLYVDWQCRFVAHRRWLLSRHKEDDAIELLEDKIRAVHRRLPAWVKQALPLKDKPQRKAMYTDSGSYILAVPENVATSEARGGTASGVVVDEGALQQLFAEIVAAALPMCDKIFAVSTPNIGNPGAEAYKRYLDEGKEQPA